MTAQLEGDHTYAAPTPARPSVLERVTEILNVFMLGSERVTLDDITDHTGLPRSTAFRLLGQLVDLHWLEHDRSGYRIGPRWQWIGTRFENNSALRSAASPVINDLFAATGAVVHLGVLEGAWVHYLDKLGGTAARTVDSQVGARIEATRSTIGRAILAQLVPETVDALLRLPTPAQRRRSTDLVGSPAATSTGDRLHDDLIAVRRRAGLAFQRSTGSGPQLYAVGAPVLGPQGPVGGISVALTSDQVDRLAPLVLKAVRTTSETLFPGWSPGTRNRLGPTD